MTRVNYVIACWMGKRNHEDERQVAERTLFLREHLDRLDELKHGLDQITIVLATGGDAAAEQQARVLAAERTLVLERPNAYYSYGSWRHAFLTLKQAFSHYIFVEDDYLPCFDGFDEALLEIAVKKNTYVCGLNCWKQMNAAISNSVVPSRILKQVMLQHFAEHLSPTPAPSDGYRSQISWSLAFFKRGYLIEDWIDTHSSPFWNGHQVRWYGHPRLPPLFVPFHAVGRKIVITRSGSDGLSALIDKSGKVTPLTPNDSEIWGEYLSRSLDDGCYRFPSEIPNPALV